MIYVLIFISNVRGNKMSSMKIVYTATIIYKVLNVFIIISFYCYSFIRTADFKMRITETAVNTKSSIVFMASQTKIAPVIRF